MANEARGEILRPVLFLAALAIGINYYPYVGAIIDSIAEKINDVVNPSVKSEKKHTTLAEEIQARNNQKAEAKERVKEERAEEKKNKPNQFDWIEV